MIKPSIHIHKVLWPHCYMIADSIDEYDGRITATLVQKAAATQSCQTAPQYHIISIQNLSHSLCTEFQINKSEQKEINCIPSFQKPCLPPGRCL
eukprot:Gb_01781 [translate_table: standard]